MAKGGKARERFRAKQQRNRIVAQLEQLHREGFTDEDIRGRKNAYAELMGGAPSTAPVAAPATTTVKDGDTIETISQRAGTSPADLLAANPELKYVRTGMVLNTPKPAPLPGSQEWRDRGGIGLPSNAAFGKTTTNPRGTNPTNNVSMWGTTTPGYSPVDPRKVNMWGTSTPGYNTNFGQVSGMNTYRPDPNVFAGSTTMQYAKQPTAPKPATPQAPAGFTDTFNPYSMLEENYHYNLLRKVKSPTYTPSQADLDYLVHMKLIKPTQTPAYQGGGGGGYRRSGGGGGGGSSGVRASRATGGGQARLPAFSNNASFRGLVSWRI